MMRFRMCVLLAALAAAAPAFAAGGGGGGGGGGSGWAGDKIVDPDMSKALEAIDAKNWNDAVVYLEKSLQRDDSNADAYNYLGYSERQRGNLDAAFRHYEKALALNPKHKGAHEYVGEAYLMAGNVAKAEEHLATLDKICFFTCDEYTELKEKIEAYKAKHAKD